MTLKLKLMMIPALAVLIGVSALAGDRTEPAKGPLALRAAKVLTGTGAVHEDGVVLIRGGKIEAVGSNLSIPAGYEVKDFGAAVIAPGLVDPDTSLGATGQNSEPVDAVQPDAAAEDVFDRFHDDFERALAQGITSVLITPSAENVVGGTAAAVKTAGCTLEERVLRTGGPLVLTVAGSTFKGDRAPTSHVGAADLMRRTIEEARAIGSEGRVSERLRAFAAGKLDGFFRAWQRYDMDRALALQKEFGLRLALVGVSDAWEMIDELGEAGLPLVMGGYNFDTPVRVLRAPGAAAARGLKIAFTAGSPGRNPAFLRVTAALAVRHGMERDAALAALTSHPAEITGIAHRVGSLAPGKDADVAVFSGDPLDLTARVLAVYVDGKLAFAGCPASSKAESEVR
jgi:imidazolonepropionase-like amidohydrolase